MPVPLAIALAPSAYELAVVALGVLTLEIAALPQGREAMKALGKALTKPIPVPVAPDVIRRCPTPKCEEKCGPLVAKINKVMEELWQRLKDMEKDKHGLYKIRPQTLPGIGNWPGHIQQYQNKQTQLQRLLIEAAASGCRIPPGAWRLATRKPPKKPKKGE